MGSAQYDKENTVVIGIKLNKNTDVDILGKLNSVPNKQGYIKALIRADIDRPKEMIFEDIGLTPKLRIRGNNKGKEFLPAADIVYEHVIEQMKARKIDYIDKTKKGGGLYFFDVRISEELKKAGYKVYFAEAGTKNTDGIPAWYIKL